jgi:hypothetical protein
MSSAELNPGAVQPLPGLPRSLFPGPWIWNQKVLRILPRDSSGYESQLRLAPVSGCSQLCLSPCRSASRETNVRFWCATWFNIQVCLNHDIWVLILKLCGQKNTQSFTPQTVQCAEFSLDVLSGYPLFTYIVVLWGLTLLTGSTPNLRT